MGKNLLYRAVALGILPFLLTACSRQDNELMNVETERVPLEISAGIDTRAIIQGSTLPEESQFGIFGVTKETEELQEDIENVSVEYVKGKCTLSRDVLLDQRPTYIYAYYPYSEKAWLNRVPVEMNAGTNDYLYGCSYGAATGQNTTVNNTQAHATIRFKHAMAQIRLIAYKTADYKGDAFINTLVVNGVPLHGTMEVTTGSIKTTEWGNMTFKITNPGNLQVEGKGETTYRFLAIPTDEVAKRAMLIELDGEQIPIPLPATAWEAGLQYTYKLVVDSDHNVIVTAGEITPWENNMMGDITMNDNNYVK